MRLSRLSLCLLVIAWLLSGCGEQPWEPAAETGPGGQARPNILLILADDVGYTDLGAMGSEIRTPTLDELAREGVLMTQFYANPTCSASRAALLTGADHHRVGFGSMQWVMTDNQRGQTGYEGYLNERVVTVASLLQDAGYHTAMAGKWDLGGAPGQGPDQYGFAQSFALMGGGASHFHDATAMLKYQRGGANYQHNGESARPLPRDFYSSLDYTDRALAFIDTATERGKPFFTYLAYTAPHWPLHIAQQISDAQLDALAERYAAGYEVLREQRIAALKARGLMPAGAPAAPFADHVPRWTDLSPARQRIQARKMAVYAAMIEYMDGEIRRLLDGLRERGLARNTVVIFASDNGPEGNDIGNLPGNQQWIPRRFDNSLDNIGRIGSYTWTGPGWAQASAGHLRLYKAMTTEGGIRVPAIVHWPAAIPGGRRSAALARLEDITATVLDYAGTTHPGSEYQGRPVWPLQGVSMRPMLEGRAQAVHPPGAEFGQELFGRRSLRRGDWKVLWQAPPFGKGRWELYNLARDPAETQDLSAARPDILAQLTRAWERYRDQNAVVLPPKDVGYGKPGVIMAPPKH